MKHSESLGKTTKIAKIDGLTCLFLFILFFLTCWRKVKIQNFWCVLFRNCVEQLGGMQNIYKGAHSQVVSATFLNVWPPVLWEKTMGAHTYAQIHTYVLYIEREWNREELREKAGSSVSKICPGEMMICSKRPMKHAEHQRSLNHRECFTGNQRHICRQLHHTTVSVWSWCTSSRALKHWVLKHPNVWVSPAERRFLLNKARTYCITMLGIWNAAVSARRFVLHLKDMLSKPSRDGRSRRWCLPELCGYLRHSSTWDHIRGESGEQSWRLHACQIFWLFLAGYFD